MIAEYTTDIYRQWLGKDVSAAKKSKRNNGGTFGNEVLSVVHNGAVNTPLQQ
jgi:hypothetical protein